MTVITVDASPQVNIDSLNLLKDQPKRLPRQRLMAQWIKDENSRLVCQWISENNDFSR